MGPVVDTNGISGTSGVHLCSMFLHEIHLIYWSSSLEVKVMCGAHTTNSYFHSI